MSRYAADGRVLGFLAEPEEPARPRLGRYRLGRILGIGGMATVYEAEDPDLRRRVALKVLRDADPAVVARFHREAVIAAQLRHSNIVAVHEVGLVQDALGAPRHFIALDLVTGRSLAEVLAAGRTPRAELLRILEEVARAADFAHARGVIHRDLKPANVLIEAGGRTLLTDFGLAHGEGFSVALTQTRAVLGTPAYMAPEQVRGRAGAADARTDVYALGVVLYEILAGRRPFAAGPAAVVFRRILDEEPERPGRVRPGVPADLEAICLKALDKEPARRYATAGELAEDVARHRRGEPVRARAPGAAARLWRRCVRQRWIVLPSAAALALGLALAGEAFQVAARARAERAARQDLEEGRLHLERGLPGGAHGPRTPLDRQDDLEEARRLFAAAVARAPHLPEAHDALGRARVALGAVDRGVAEFDCALALDPAYAPAWVHRGDAHAGAGAYDVAQADYARALALDPAGVAALRSRARLRQVQGDLAGAIADWSEVLRTHAEMADAWRRRGELRERTGDLEGAAADYTQALGLLAHAPELYFLRGRVLLRRGGGDGERALADLKRAVAELPPRAPLYAAARESLRDATARAGGPGEE